jgi:hypothetical protein
MGFLLSVLYFVTYYLTPAFLFGPLAAAHVELILAALVLFVSLPALTRSFMVTTPQALALIGLAIVVFVSVLLTGWAGGAVQAFMGFIPNAFAYYLVCLHCNTKKKLQILVLMMLFVCLYVIARGCIDIQREVPGSVPPQSEASVGAPLEPGDAGSPYLVAMTNGAGELFYRLKGLGSINDPNDFGQLIACVIPLVFIFRRPKRMLQNIIFVALPVCVLLYGAFLTHSRGALVALMAMAVVAARRRIGTLPALLLAGGVFVAAMSLHFTGGRDISADAGSDRTELWSSGLQLLKSHPFFGVGLGGMPDFTDSHQTAHNSVVVCAAELGLVGLYFWCLFLFPTVKDAIAIASPAKVSDAEPVLSEETFFPQATRKIEAIDKAEINRLGQLLVLSLTGFLVAGWFLSRAYVMTFFLLGGMVEAVFEMALRQGMIAPRLRLVRVLPFAGGLAISLVLLMYIMLRIANLMH